MLSVKNLIWPGPGKDNKSSVNNPNLLYLGVWKLPLFNSICCYLDQYAFCLSRSLNSLKKKSTHMIWKTLKCLICDTKSLLKKLFLMAYGRKFCASWCTVQIRTVESLSHLGKADLLAYHPYMAVFQPRPISASSVVTTTQVLRTQPFAIATVSLTQFRKVLLSYFNILGPNINNKW